MAVVILNPTDDPIKVQWDGLDHYFIPDERREVPDNMAKAVIHNYGARGLISLKYGDEGEIELQKIKAGREDCDTFWTKQVVNQNQLNEQREQSNRPFLKPQPQIVYHAARLGLKLIEPYKLEDASSKQVALLMQQNKDLEAEIKKKDSALDTLKNEVSELTKNFKDFMALAGSQAEAAKGGNGDTDFETLKATVVKMNKKRFLGWMNKHWNDIQSYPPDVKKDIADKHQNLYGIPFPVDRPKVETYDVA